jgi:hypothetical protein
MSSRTGAAPGGQAVTEIKEPNTREPMYQVFYEMTDMDDDTRKIFTTTEKVFQWPTNDLAEAQEAVRNLCTMRTFLNLRICVSNDRGKTWGEIKP